MAITPYLLYQDAGAAVNWLVRRSGCARRAMSSRAKTGASITLR